MTRNFTIQSLLSLVSPAVESYDGNGTPSYAQLNVDAIQPLVTPCFEHATTDDIHRQSMIAFMVWNIYIACLDNELEESIDDDLVWCYLNDIDWSLIEDHELEQWLSVDRMQWFQPDANIDHKSILKAAQAEHLFVARKFLKTLGELI